MTQKKVGIWIRVSTEDQARGESPEHHEKRAKMYAELKNWKVVTVYHLEGVSGKSVVDHPEAQRMMHDVQTGRIEALIFSKLARLARNTKQLLDFADYFQKNGADLVSLQESIDTSTPAGRLFYTLIAAMAQWEREEIADRVSASIPIRAQLGKHIGGPAPYGYLWKDGELTLVESEVPIRKRMFELYLEHRRKKTVVQILNNDGLRTRAGAKWTTITLTRLLRDPIAKGLRRSNFSTRTKDENKYQLKPEEDWVFLPAPAIVPSALWDEVNALLDTQTTKRDAPLKKTKHLFTSIAKCHCKGVNMYVPSNSPKYVCKKCRNKILAEDLEAIYHSQLKSFVISDELISEHMSQSTSLLKEKEQLLSSMTNEAKALKERLDSLVDLHAKGQIPTDGFKEHYDPLFQQKKQLDDKLLELQTEYDYLKTHLPSKDEVLLQVKDVYSRWNDLSFDERRNIVEVITESIIVGDDEIEINLNHFPNPDMLGFPERATFGVQNPRVLYPKYQIRFTAQKPLHEAYPACLETIGDYIRTKRLDSGLFLREVAEQLQVSKETLNDWELHKAKPLIQQYPAIIQFLGCDPLFTKQDSLGERLKHHRRKHGITRKEVADTLGVCTHTLGRLEAGGDSYGRTVEKVSDYLN